MKIDVISKKLSLVLLAFLMVVTTFVANSTMNIDKVHAQSTTVTEDPSFDEFKGYEIETVNPQGTEINLFDYWYTANRTDGDNNTFDSNQNINKDHQLKFFNRQTNPDNNLNKWTGRDGRPRTNIVEPGIDENGYPVLRVDSEGVNNNITSRESLDYLFNPTYTDANGNAQAGKASYTNVTGLLKVNEEGYYKYCATENFASYNEANNSFSVYNAPAIYNDTSIVGDSSPYNFFPFNTAKQVFNKEGNAIVSKPVNALHQNSDIMNHAFGLTMTTRFIQSKDGLAPNGKHVTYSFSGDDDVWVYIDDVLVGDLGGIHDECSLDIDFNTGKILIANVVNKENKTDTTLRACFENYNKFYGYQPGDEKYKDLGKIFVNDTNRFVDDSYHTLKFFYLERGGYASNLTLMFNMKSVQGSEMRKMDAVGNPLKGVEFKLYKTDDSFNKEQNAQPISTGSTDGQGYIRLVDADGKLIDFDTLHRNNPNKNGNDYYLLEEVSAPEGYRKSEPVKLTYKPIGDGSHGYLSTSVKHAVQSGGYATPKVLISANEEIGLVNGETKSLANGRMYAVILKKGNGSEWHPVSGNPVSGWVQGEAISDGSGINQSLVDAIKSNENAYAKLNASGAYELSIEDLPGKVEDYYWVNHPNGGALTENDKYTINFYYTENTNIANLEIEDLTRVSLESNREFGRYFASKIYLSNPQNTLIVQKLDSNGTPIGDIDDSSKNATFTLYKLENGQEFSYDTLKINQYTKAKDKLNMEHVAVFPSDGKVLANGEYILRETTAPEGYHLLGKDIKVVVTDKGVYADAGDRHDGIHVLNGVGYLFKSLEQFGAEDDFDSTLSHIKVNHLVKNDADINTLDDNSTYKEHKDSLHLKYQKQDPQNDKVAFLNYVSEEAGGKVLWSNDVGFAKVKIYQCNDTDTNTNHMNGKPHTNLQKLDVTNAFSLSTIVQVMDQPVIGGKKVLDGRKWLETDEFKFNIKPYNFADNKDATYTNIAHPTSVSLEYDANNKDHKFELGKFELKPEFELDVNESPKTFDYLIEEIKGEIPGITYDKGQYKLTVTVTKHDSQHADGLPSYTLSYALAHRNDEKSEFTACSQLGDAVVFTNKYAPKPTVTPGTTPESTDTPTASPKPTGTPETTPEPTGTPTASPKPTGTPETTPEPTGTPTASPKPTVTPEPTVTPGTTPESTDTPTPTPKPTVTPETTPESTDTPTASPKPTVTPETTPEPTGTPTASPKPTGTPETTPEPTGTPTASPKPTVTPNPTKQPSNVPVNPVDPQDPQDPPRYLDNNPNTSDSSMLTTWLVLLGTSIVGIIGGIVYKKKKNK